MASSIYLASMALMALFLLVIVGAVVGRDWKAYTPTLRPEGSSMSSLLGNETVWVLLFVVAAIAAGGGATLFVSGDAFSSSLVSTGGIVVVVALALAFLFYLFYGTYAAAKARGFQRAAAVMAGSWVLGLLVIVAIALKLVTG
jgi:hypothetical protein